MLQFFSVKNASTQTSFSFIFRLRLSKNWNCCCGFVCHGSLVSFIWNFNEVYYFSKTKNHFAVTFFQQLRNTYVHKISNHIVLIQFKFISVRLKFVIKFDRNIRLYREVSDTICYLFIKKEELGETSRLFFQEQLNHSNEPGTDSTGS